MTDPDLHKPYAGFEDVPAKKTPKKARATAPKVAPTAPEPLSHLHAVTGEGDNEELRGGAQRESAGK